MFFSVQPPPNERFYGLLKGRRVDKVLMAEMGVEGGGITIYGSQLEGVWSFWTEGNSMELDDNDHEVWRSWSSEPVSSLDLVVTERLAHVPSIEDPPRLRGMVQRNLREGTKHATRGSATISG